MNAVLPAQIRAQIIEANELAAQVGLRPEAPATEAPPEQPAAIQPSPGEPAASTEQVAQPSNPNAPVDWEHRYNSMKGRHDALAADLARAQAEVATLRSQLNKKTIETTRKPVPVPADFDLTPEERRDYGDDFVRVMEKRAKAALHDQLVELREQQEAIRRQLEGVKVNTEVDARSRMISSLDTLPYDWREVNKSDGWRAWLTLQDPLSGMIRQDLLMSAWEANDAARMRRFFDGYLAETGMASAAPLNTRPDTGASAPAISMASLAAPGSARSGAATALPPEKPTFTTAQIGRFYDDIVRGKFRGRDADRKALQAQIDAAVAEGRVRG